MKSTHKSLRARVCLFGAALSLGLSIASSADAASFVFNAGAPDLRLGALSRRPDGAGKIETETADDFFLQETTVLKSATIHGLIPVGTPAAGITSVEVEIYHVFPLDSANPPSNRVPSRQNSPSDVEIDSATRDAKDGSLRFDATVTASNLSVANTVVNGIHASLTPATHGEGAATGDQVELKITFTKPIVLPAGHYFFRPEVGVSTGDFLFLSAPRPMQPPATIVAGDLQGWIRNAALSPDWLRIGTDIIAGDVPPTFNMSFSLNGETIPAGTPGQASCHGQTISALSYQFGGIEPAAVALGFSSVHALQDTLREFCEQS